MLNIGYDEDSTDSGDWLPYVKFNAQVGRWYKKTDDGDKEVENFQAIVDFDNIQTGWLMFKDNAPYWTPDDDISTTAERPHEDCKRGFKVHVYAKKQLDGVRSLMANANAFTNAIKAIYAEYEESGKAGDGQLPVVKCTGVTSITGKNGTNYAPKLEITKWVKRPSEDDLPILSGGASTPAPAPVTNTASDAIGELEDEFV